MDYRWSIALRPYRFSMVLGQSHVINFFQKILADYYSDRAKRLPVGALFGGRSGVGKTTVARIIAASLNCPNKTNRVEPCGKCPACISIRSGKGLEVMEIDASFFGLVDNVRTLRDRLTSYSFSTYRVVILDECHMMSKESFNVLLKLLEEPPVNVFFILITTEVEKVLDTVRSRLIEFKFRLVEWASIWKFTQRLFNRIKVMADEVSLHRLYQMSGYNVRDYFMTIEYLVGMSSGSITKELIEKSFGDVFIYDSVLDGLCACDYDKVVADYEKYATFEADFDLFLSGFLDFVIEKLRSHLRRGGEEVFLYSTIVSIIYKFMLSRVALKGLVAAKVLFYDIVFQLTKGSFGLSRTSKKDKAVSAEEIFNMMS